MPEFSLLQVQPATSPEEGAVLFFQRHDAAPAARHRVVTLKELAYLPLDAREDPDVLGKQWAALRGLYQTDADFIYVAAGFYQPRHVGLVQFYGTAAEGPDPEEARGVSTRRMRAVEAVLANYVLSRLETPQPERLQSLTARMRSLPTLLAVLGHPDPRRSRRGLGTGPGSRLPEDDLAAQQGEILMRGLAKLREEFVFLVTAQHVARPQLHHAMVRMSQVTSQYASRQRGSLSVGFSVALPLAAALSQNVQSQSGHSGAETAGQGLALGAGVSETEGTSAAAGGSLTETRSASQTIGESETRGASRSLTWSEGASWSDSLTEGRSTSHTQGTAEGRTESSALTRGASESRQWSTSTGEGGSRTEGESRSVVEASSWSESAGSARSLAQSRGESWSQGETEGASRSRATGSSLSKSTQSSTAVGQQTGFNASGSAGLAALRAGVGGSAGFSSTDTDGASEAQGHSHTQTDGASSQRSSVRGGSAGETTGQTRTRTESSGGSFSEGAARSTQTARSWSAVETAGHGRAATESRSESQGRSWTESSSAAQGESWQHGRSQGGSRTLGETAGETAAVASSLARAEGVSRAEAQSWQEGTSRSRAESRSLQWSAQQGTSRGWSSALGRGFSGGFSSGLVPGVHIGRGWQTEDDTAQRLTEVTRQLSSLLDRASVEGAFMTTALLFTGREGKDAAAALVPQAFHGPDVPTPVLTRPADAELRAQALAFQPSLAPVPNPFAIDVLWTRWSTLLTPGMLAAYTAPNLFEEGAALTFQEKLPPLAFYPELDGDAVCGNQISPETGDLTPVPLRLARRRHFHTAFCGDTGFGKSVAAERLVYESTRRWQLRSVILDFGTGWRKLLNAPGLEGHVEIRQLSPGGVRPLRWNPLQIGRHVLPEVQWRSFCDVFGQIAQLGQRRQIHELRDALRRLYLGAGVLVDDPEVRASDVWGAVRHSEADLVSREPGAPLAHLTADERQTLAVERSRVLGLRELHDHIKETLTARGRRDQMLRTVLEGILFRLHPLVQGAASQQYRRGPDCADINEIVPGGWGVAVLEGGSFLDDFSKAFLLGWAAWHLYQDAVQRRLRDTRTRPARVQIVFEEANKILAGLEQTGAEGGRSVAEQFEAMWRDSRKYGIWLHLVSQTPSAIPPGILSSCNNVFIAQLKNPRDRDLMLAALHRSEKGFVDETWRRFLASMPVGRSVVKLGYAFERGEVEPTYIQPLLLDVPEPSDADIEARLGRVNLAAETAATEEGGLL